ncbi:hypothetical protein AMJ39_02080 [candidate division TA06 bacterium DG_24]|jgi:putative hydrolase of the HAD superfamily|uniref:Haloacid dehalogenase n=3 Tax=Bacteria division TA06 TaxID=1156500 RepID=A0A0S8JRX7_UNCT6|nr:MAG: hypothetical protein AMJ39_02080 [candidate division TA06 bacterium DG_24]KPK70053.1 MAG: hypothetical protein AMJ82_04125 [candidate division TA06 bacterium SM23_40]KPL11533.1 MAG: hypothetical protein AMJ71_00595 [candidate division TA06 bacterium SM1_40]
MIKAVFFDFGATLMDGESDRTAHRELMREVAESLGLSISADELLVLFEGVIFPRASIRPRRWVTTRQLVEETLPALLGERFGADLETWDWDWFWKTYFDTHREHASLFPAARRTLDWVKARDVHLGLISDIDDDYLYFQMDTFGITGLFDSITTSEAVGVGKPNPKIFLAALEQAGCSGGEAVYVGDSREKDMMGAKAVGMMTIWLGSGECPEADHQIDDIGSVPSILEPEL